MGDEEVGQGGRNFRMDLGGKVGKEKRRHDDRKCAILEQEIKGRCHVLVFSFTGLLFLSFFFLFF